MRWLWVLLTVLLGLSGVLGRGIPFLKQQQSQSPSDYNGLYMQTDAVDELIGKEQFQAWVFQQKRAAFVEFYNSFCGFCRRFAPHWIQLGEDTQNWRDIVAISAIDCSSDENSDVCRDFEVMAYPTIRYFPPNYEEGAKQIGKSVLRPDHDTLKQVLVNFLLTDEQKLPSWPDLEDFTADSAAELFTTAPQNIKIVYVILENVQEPNKNTTGAQVILDLHKAENVIIRRASSMEFLHPKTTARPALFAVHRENLLIEQLTVEPSQESIRNKILSHMQENNLDIPVSAVPVSAAPNKPTPDWMKHKQDKAIQDKVAEMKGVVFQADLEQAVRFALFHEIPRYEAIKDDRLLALKRFLSVLSRYFPFGDNGRRFLKELETFVGDKEESLSGEAFENEAKRLEEHHRPIFSSSKFVGCYSEVDGLRRYPCSLWLLFHHLTVAAVEQNVSTDPLEVLHAMHGYIKHFFGCTDCSNHFQEMAKKNRMFSVASQDNAILWLWSAHNEANKRLSGDTTEDPAHPKIQFPGAAECPQCRRGDNASHNDEDSWDRTEVLFYLRRIHSPQNISRLGVDDEAALPASLDVLRAKRYTGD
ncbi:sulfhydryl oxidase 1 isoform X2 [Phlebotomus argentipes]|uniref:sulfhydryl oxidase 1 isoform X2 n=1 Tax=Phlebotomus argentipes TaxID=94469 RepID=UPI002892A845|nr:sulfhydryl oxidase 1 isoform X2 [Phlebotomus argentipes]